MPASNALHYREPLSLMPQPLVTIIIPVFNAANYLDETMESVLSQTFTDFECILIDDASTDHSAQLIRNWCYRDSRISSLVNKRNLGVSATRNTGLLNAKGDYIALLDADDIWLPDKLALQVAILNNEPNIGLVSSCFGIINSHGELITPRSSAQLGQGKIPLQQYIFDRISMAPSAVIFRAKCLEKAGLFNTDYFIAEDFAFWLHILRHYPMKTTTNVLLHYRVHSDSASANKLRNREQKIIVLEEEVLNKDELCSEVTPQIQIDLQRRYLSLAKRYRQIGNKNKNWALLKKVLLMPSGNVGHKLESILWMLYSVIFAQ